MAIVQELDLDLSGFDSKLARVADAYEQLEAAAKKANVSTPFKGQAEQVTRLNTQLRAGAGFFEHTANGARLLKGDITRLSGEFLKLFTNQSKAAKPANWKDTQEQIKKTKDELDALNKKYDETVGKQKKASSASTGSNFGGNLLSSASGILGGLGFGIGAAEVIKNIVSIRSEYQKLGKQLEISLGSQSAGAAAQRLITDFANKTPLSIQETTAAFNRLVGVGIVPTEKQLFQLSDIALANRKTINDYVEAIADAQTGEYERLKEFGVRAAKAGDQVTFTFRGQTTTVQNTAKAIDEYLLSLGSVAGISGQTEEVGKLLEGRWSTLKDTFAGVANEVGQILQPALEGLLDVTQKAATGLSGYLKDLRAVAAQRESEKIGGSGSGGLGAFFQSVFNPHQFNQNATEAIIEQNERDIAKKELEARRRARRGLAPVSDDPLEQKRIELAEQQRKSDAQRKAAADEKEADRLAEKKKTKQKQIDLDILREAAKQVEERKKLADELTKLEADAEKSKLETLDKSSQEYIDLKRKYDLAEVDSERKKLIELGQLATGSPYYNKKTQRVEIQKNQDFKLPTATEKLLQDKKDAIDSAAQVESFEAAEARGRATFERILATERLVNTRKFGETELELRQKLLDAETTLLRTSGESEADFEKRKNAELLAIRLKYYEDLLKLAQNDPSQKTQILGLKEAIAGIKKDIVENSSLGKTGPTDIYDLLGISFSSDPKKNDSLKQTVDSSVRTVLDGANQILAQQVQADQARVSSIDAQIQAKQNEVEIELELSRQGLANNLSIKRQEQEQLKQERAKAVEAQRRDQAIQLGLNLVLQESQMALALAKIIANAADFGPLFPLIAGLEIASMFAIFASGITQIASLPKYHDGDEVTLETARKRTTGGNRQADEVDARLQVGEGVTRKESYQPNKLFFSRVNKLGRAMESRDLSDLLAGTGVDLPEAVRQQDLVLINQYHESRGSGPDREVHKRLDELNGHVQSLISETRKGNTRSRTVLPDGRIREVDEKGNVRVYRQV